MRVAATSVGRPVFKLLIIMLSAAAMIHGAASAEATDESSAAPEATPVSAQQAETLLRAWVTESLAGTQTEQAAPSGSVFGHVEVRGGAVVLYLDMPSDFLDHLTSEQCEDVIHGELQRLWPLEGVRAVALYARPIGDEKAEYKPLPSYLPPVPPQREKAEEVAPADIATAGGLPANNPGQPQGVLSGKTIFLSPGHGWYYASSLSRWATQRGNNFGLIEDLSNGEAVLQHLAQYLHNAGANVWPCRERDFNTNMVMIDNTDGAPSFTTTGSWPAATASGTWKGANYQYSAVGMAETAVAAYAPNIPQAGNYSVYVWTPSASNRAADAKVRVKHTGGTTTHVLNMQRDGNTWRFLGIYYFNAGRDAVRGSVEISNQGSDTSKFVIADAVRFGGGMGDYVDGGTTSGKPRWEESGRYFPVFMGQTTTPNGTVDAMPRYADWESESWEDSIYFSWHTNAAGGRGTHMYVYASGQPPGVSGTFELFDGIAGGDSLANRIQDSVMNDIQTGWDPAWTGRKFGAYFGELNPSNNNEMPACLLEVAFHDNQLDAQSLTDPRFRDLVSRAVYQGIVDWWYFDHDGPSATPIPTNTKLPEPPTHLAVRNVGNGTLRVSWQAPPSNSGNNLLGDPATGYRVSISTDGFGFDDGTRTSALSMDFNGLTPGSVYYFRVIATNVGGQSFPSAIGGAMVSPAGVTPILVVNGFDRLDRGQMLAEDDPYDTDAMLRERPQRMNHYGYIRTYAAAIAPSGRAFDSCANEAVRDGQVTLGAYPLTIWQSGEESTTDSTFDAVEQALLQFYLGAGGRLFASGSDIGWDLDASGNGAAFYNNFLRADYFADDAGTYTVTPAPGSIFQATGTIVLDNGATIYDVDYPDVIVALGGSAAVLSYTGGSGGTAGIVHDGAYRLVYLAFPFEAITSASARASLMQAAVEFFLENRVIGDFDEDDDVDMDDWGHLQQCLTGITVPQTDPDCANARLDVDTDVDLNDVAIFQACFSGPGVPVSPECGG